MPLIDLSPAELEQYYGSSPCPENFNSFWRDSLKELAALPADPKLTPAGFQVPGFECLELHFSGVGGAVIHGVVIKPAGTGSTPAVLVFHGYSCNIGDWFSLLPYAACGMTVLAMDCRGQGGSSTDPGGVKGGTWHGHVVRGVEDAPEKLLFRNIFLDCVRLAEIAGALEWVDSARIGVTGASQGGGLALACAALAPRIRCCVPVFPFLSDYKRIWDMDLDVECYAELRDYFRKRDPLHATEAAFFEKLGYIDVQNLAERIRCPVQMHTALLDRTCPVSTQFAIYNRLRGEREMLIYPDFAHEPLPGCADAGLLFLLKHLRGRP